VEQSVKLTSHLYFTPMLTMRETLPLFLLYINSQGNSVGIATGYGLDDRCSEVRFPAGDGNFSVLHRVQTGSGANPDFYPVGTWGSFPRGKATGT
jgi:hypothetical protein